MHKNYIVLRFYHRLGHLAIRRGDITMEQLCSH